MSIHKPAYKFLLWLKMLGLLWQCRHFVGKTEFPMKEENDGEIVFLDTLLKQNIGQFSILVYRRPTQTDQYLHYSSHHLTSSTESFVSSLFRTNSIITNKDDLHKQNARIRQVLKENGYQESIISKIFKRITNTVTYPGHLGAQYTGLGTQTLAPKKSFLTSFFSVAIQQRNTLKKSKWLRRQKINKTLN